MFTSLQEGVKQLWLNVNFCENKYKKYFKIANVFYYTSKYTIFKIWQ